MKFSNKLFSTIFATGLVVLILLLLGIYKFSYNSIIESQFMYTKSIANEVSDDIDHILFEKVKTALTLANTPIIEKFLETSNVTYADLPDKKRKESINLLNKKWKSTKDHKDPFILKFTDNIVSRHLKNQQAVLKGEYGEIFLTNKYGALVASTSKLSTYAHGHKYWWLGSYNNGTGAVFFDDRGYDDSVGGYVLGLVVPVRKGSEIIGILKCNLNILGSISKLISGAQDKLLGKFKLIRSGGMVVFEEGFEPLSTQIHDDVFKQINSKNNKAVIINNSGEKELVGFSQIKLTKGEKGYGFGGTFESIDHKKGNTGESWYILCCRKMSIVQAPIIKSVKWVVVIGIVVILVLGLVSYVVGRKVAQPIALLDTATQKIGKGDFKYRIELKQKDEIGNLGNSINNMASRLQRTTTSIELLEAEVIDRKLAEKALRESEIKFRNLVETSSDWIWEVSVEGFYTYSSPQVEEILGYKPEEIIGKTPFDLMPPEEGVRIAGICKEIVKKRAPIISLENINLCKDGSPIVIETSGVPVLDETGKVLFYRGIDRNITERKQAEEEREKLIKEREKAIEDVKILSGLLPICSKCKKIRDDKGYWN
ncbi:MAG: PAS domain S-box protein, partial [Desulfobacteraceae bacterium]|nr:PAS domain S-box protein [Desulfobacteraceae bacterium]